MSSNKLSLTRLWAVGSVLVAFGTFGYYAIDGLIDDSQGGSHLVNSFYCSVITLTTVGYGDICPGDMDDLGRLFVVALSFGGLGFFCGPVMDAASSWSRRIPGGAFGPAVFALYCGTLLFVHIEGMDIQRALYCAFITGTTTGYGDLSPKTDAGRVLTAF
mmetsp:Transcript_20488/g.48133  ORF Transcript_20488/g.48133 Transcript_20488/m.48133 type:complete len:160 (-) Transcript_20488:342-821(-)